MIDLKKKQRKVNKALFGTPTGEGKYGEDKQLSLFNKPNKKVGRQAQLMLSKHLNNIKKQREYNGVSISNLASKYNVYSSSMCYFLHKHDIYVRNHINISRSEFEEVIKKHNNGSPIMKISKTLNMPVHRIEKILYIRFHQNTGNVKHYKTTALDRRKAKVKNNLNYYYQDLYIQKHYTLEQIAKISKTNFSFIQTTFAKNKLPVRAGTAPGNKQLEARQKPESSLANLILKKVKNNHDKVKKLEDRCTILSDVIIKQSKKLQAIRSQKATLKKLLNQL